MLETDLDDLDTSLALLRSEASSNGEKLEKLGQSVRAAAILQEAGRLAGQDPITQGHLDQAKKALAAAERCLK